MATVSSSTRPVKGARVYPPVHGVARWRGDTVRRDLAEGTAWLQITTENASRPGIPVVTNYWVEELRDDKGVVLGYRLTKMKPDGSATGEVYDLDCTFAGTEDPQFVSCDCLDALSRNRRGGCKHARACCAALKHIPD